MGIRIHKMCGYGLTDVVEDDPRINYKSPIFTYEIGGDDALRDFVKFSTSRTLTAPTLLDYQFVQQQLDRTDKIPYREKYDIQDCVEWGTEDGGLQNVLCLRPVTSNDWRRGDDMLDWLDETYVHGSNDTLASTLKVLPHGIYPYSGLYMDKRTGKRVMGHEVMTWVRAWTNIEKDQQEEMLAKDPSVLDEITTTFGMTSVEAHENIVPEVPDEIRNLAEFLELFTDENTWKDLRPMMYNWWS